MSYVSSIQICVYTRTQMAALLNIVSFEGERCNLQLTQCFNEVSVKVDMGKIGQRIRKRVVKD